MLLKQYKKEFSEGLQAIFDEKEVESFFYIILEAFHDMKRVDLALNPNFELDSTQLLQWETVLAQLKEQKPIQYILGETEFYGLPFYVSEHTLIPRPETEELVEWIIVNSQNRKFANPLKILDIGTGSGCIGIALAKNIPKASVFAIDVSEKALAIAKRNAKRNGVEITLQTLNILDVEDLTEKFDIIVSNPPYVRQLEKKEMLKNVLDYEPHLALFVADDDALVFYRKIAELACKHLTEKGQLYFEINQYLGKEMIALLEQYHFKNIELKKDIYGNDRMVSCSL
jgi:release factor glutamine methyltransferase